MTSIEAPKRRHPILVYLAGIPVVGLGFLLTGRFVPAVASAVFALAMPVLVPLVAIDVLHRADLLPSLVLASSLAVRMATATVAAWLAFTDAQRTYRSFEHPWWVFGFALVVTAAWHQTTTRIAPQIAVVARLTDSSLAPQADIGSLVVVPTRGFDPNTLTINELVAVRAGSEHWNPMLLQRSAGCGVAESKVVMVCPASLDVDTTCIPVNIPSFARVIATAGSVVEVDISGNIKVDGFPVVATPCAATVPHKGGSCIVEKQATPQGAKERFTTASSFARQFAPTTVGPGQVFVLSDDRGHQLNAAAGLVMLTDIQGRAILAH